MGVFTQEWSAQNQRIRNQIARIKSNATLDDDARQLISLAQSLRSAIQSFTDKRRAEIAQACNAVADKALPDASTAQRAALIQHLGSPCWQAIDAADNLESRLQEMRNLLLAITGE